LYANRRFTSISIAAVVMGVGLGGLFDGIVLHQILQWHHMVSTPLPPVTVEDLETNTLADGLFHAAAWALTVGGLVTLLVRGDDREVPGRGRRVLGGLLIGWGGFNLVEGIIDHHLLGLHHVRPGPDEALYDLGFLIWGAAMVLLGWWALAPQADVRSSTIPDADARS
jgi:uncharacterized membrane protein